MNYEPPKALGLATGGFLLAWPVAVAVVLLTVLPGSEVGWGVFFGWIIVILMVLAALLLAYWMYGLATLRYTVSRDALGVRWGFVKLVIPLEDIERLVPGRTQPEPRVRGVSWFGHHTGWASLPRFGRTTFYSTHRGRDEVLYVVTPYATYGLTVLDPASFAEEIQNRQALGPVVAQVPRVGRRGPAILRVLEDRWSLGFLGAAAALNVALFAYIVGSYDGLPALIPVEFPDASAPERLVERSEVLRIGLLGLAVLGINSVGGLVAHAWERSAALVLFATAALLQAVLIAAAAITIEQV